MNSLPALDYSPPMRQPIFLIVLCGLLALNLSASAAGKIIKVLPQYLDEKGRTALSPNLFERDGYQAFLRDNPSKCSGKVFKIEWKAGGAKSFTLRVEMRGEAKGDSPKTLTVEKLVVRRSGFGRWDNITLEGKEFAEFGKVVAWRATLWNGNEMLSEQKSFLW